jgi:hypothetical protein
LQCHLATTTRLIPIYSGYYTSTSVWHLQPGWTVEIHPRPLAEKILKLDIERVAKRVRKTTVHGMTTN